MARWGWWCESFRNSKPKWTVKSLNWRKTSKLITSKSKSTTSKRKLYAIEIMTSNNRHTSRKCTMKTKLCATMPMCCDKLCWIQRGNSELLKSSLRKRRTKTWSLLCKFSRWKHRCVSSLSSFKRRRWSWRLLGTTILWLFSHPTIKRDLLDRNSKLKSRISNWQQTLSPKIQIV